MEQSVTILFMWNAIHSYSINCQLASEKNASPKGKKSFVLLLISNTSQQSVETVNICHISPKFKAMLETGQKAGSRFSEDFSYIYAESFRM